MPTSQKKPVDCSELAASLAELALAHGESGVNTLDGVVDAIRKDLPEVDRNTIADAIVAYSARPKVEPLNRDEMKARIAELKRVARRDVELRDQIETLKKKSAAAESRPKDKKIYDDRVASLEKERDDLRKGALKEKAETKAEADLTAEIKDLEYQIATKEFKDKPEPEKRVYSDKIQALRDKRAELRGEVSDAKAEIRTEESLTAEIADLEKQFETKQYKEKTPAEKKVYSEKITALRGEREAIKKKIAAEKSAANAEARVHSEITALEKQMETGEFKSKPASEKKKYSDKMQALVDRRAELRKGVAGKKAEARTVESLSTKIADLQEQLSTGNLKDAAPREKKAASDEVEALRSERDRLQKEVNSVRGEAATETQLTAEIADLQKQMETGEFKAKAPAEKKAYSDKIQALRDERDGLRRGINEKKAVDNFEQRIKDQIAEYSRQLSTGDIKPPAARVKKMYDERLESLRFKRDQLRKKISQEIEKGKEKSVFRAFVEGPSNEARALMTTGELSYVLRQGGFFSIANPVSNAKQIIPSLRAFKNEKFAHKVDQSLRPGNENSVPNATLYEKAGLKLPDPDFVDNGKMSEEMFQTDLPFTHAISKMLIKAARAEGTKWEKFTPENLIHGFGRAYITFVNVQRAQTFDAIVGGLSLHGDPTLKEAKAVAKFVNIGTGHGDFGKMEGAISAMNTAFFAPRYAKSRFDLIYEPIRAAASVVGKPIVQGVNKAFDKNIKVPDPHLFGGSIRSDVAIAHVYARYAAGVTALLTAASYIPGVEIEKDPRSTDFGKIRIGNTRLDPFSGIQQVAVFLAKQISKQSKSTATGEIKDMDARAWLANVAQFTRGKLSPLFGTAVDLTLRQNMVGQQVAPLRSKEDAAKFAANLLTPITYQDIFRIMRSEYGMSDKAALTSLAILGAGIASYDASAIQPPDDKVNVPKSVKERHPDIGNTIRLTDDEYKKLMEAHDKAVAAVEKRKKNGSMDGLLPAKKVEREKQIYDAVFDPAKEAVTIQAMKRKTGGG